MSLDDLIVVLRVAEFRNITAAATSLDMRAATASAAVKRVEQELGVHDPLILVDCQLCKLLVAISYEVQEHVI